MSSSFRAKMESSEFKSPLSCPYSVTVRRNPPRRARPTPSSAIPISLPPPSSTKTLPPPPPSSTIIPSFPIDDILSININHPDGQLIPPISESLKVFLRIRPLEIHQVSIKKKGGATKRKNAWPQIPGEKAAAPKAKPHKKSEISLTVKDPHSVTLCPPKSLQDQRRVKTEVYEGFSQVFTSDSSQEEVYGTMVNPLVEDFLKGKSGMLAALGPSGSGKTHTVFGSIRDPGMVPLALRRIFSQDAGSGTKSSRKFYLSMFEINSERGKGEKVLDLSPGGNDVSLQVQQSTIKGLQEVAIFDAQEAESVIAGGLMKRATAMTNSNSQSSRSQCIINIRCALNNIDVEAQSNGAMLTIVDLAGAEREKRTGNQGTRLLESNFINNTSMVFGLCLRSLLEHQKSPKKPLQKHFQNSLLTRYLRDYLEGKKRMTLILTVKPGEEDYSDASFLLRQASPFMNIKFDVVEELPSNSFGNKRQFQTFPKAEQLKRMKTTNDKASTGDKGKAGASGTQRKEEVTLELVKEHEPATTLVQSPNIISLEENDNNSHNKAVIEPAKGDKEHQIMIKFGKALWNVLKEYKRKLEVAEDEIHGLKESLAVEKKRSSQLEEELNDMKSLGSCRNEASEVSLVEVHESVNIVECQSAVIDEVAEDEIRSLKERLAIEVERCSELENEVNGMKSCCSCRREVPVEVSLVKVDESVATELAEIEHCQSTSMDEVRVQVSSSNLKDTEITSEVTGSMLQESVVRSSQSPVLVEDDSSMLMEGDQLQHEEEVNGKMSSPNFKDSKDINGEHLSNSKQLDDPMIPPKEIINSETESKPSSQAVNPGNNQVVPRDNVIPSEMCSVSTVSRSEVTLPPSSNLVTPGKPKRRLQPASSILLKNINSLEFDDENEKPKGRRKEKKATSVDVTKKTQGNIALLRLLTDNLHL